MCSEFCGEVRYLFGELCRVCEVWCVFMLCCPQWWTF